MSSERNVPRVVSRKRIQRTLFGENEETRGEQYFASYHFDKDNREVAHLEYEAAARTLENDERAFAASTAVVVFASGALAALIAPNAEDYISRLEAMFGEEYVLFGGSLFIFCALSLASAYFAERNAAVVYAARKVVVLRRMLSLRYGYFETVLPSNRIEGADDPFQIRMFTGWNSYRTLPIFLVCSTVSLFFLLLTSTYKDLISGYSESLNQMFGPT